LLEHYAAKSGVELLCNHIKRKIIESDPVARIDPYLEMIEVVRKSLPQDARLFEACFLIKSFEGIDMDHQKSKFNFLLQLGVEWGLGKPEILHFWDYRNWTFEERANLSTQIFNHFIRTYKNLREKAMAQTGILSERDLTIMGKTLRAYLSKEPHKIPQEFSLIEPKSIILVRFIKERDSTDRMIWALDADFMGSQANLKNKRLFQHPNLLCVCAWLVVNGHYHPSQKFTVAGNREFSILYVTEFLKQFATFLPSEDIMSQVLRQWNEKSLVKKCFVIPNWSETNDTDNLQSIMIFTMNSFGEVHFHCLDGPKCLELFVGNYVLKEFALKELDNRTFEVLRYGMQGAPGFRLATSIKQKLDQVVEHVLSSMNRKKMTANPKVDGQEIHIKIT
jgi:adenylate cyclase